MSKEKTGKLLAAAKAYTIEYKTASNITEDEKEVVAAYLKKEIIMRQLSHAFTEGGVTKGKYPAARILNTIVRMIDDGEIVIKA